MSAKQRKHHLLVADDSPTVTDLLSFLFTEEGYYVETASDGLDAIKKFYADPPDLLILDVEMPHMDGYQVCRAIKEDPDKNTVPIIILTSHDAQSDRFRGLSVGADAYLVKNLEDGLLVAKVAELVKASPWLRGATPVKTSMDDSAVLERLNTILDRRLFLSGVINELDSVTIKANSLEATARSLLELCGKMFEFVLGGILMVSGERSKLYMSILQGYDRALIPQFTNFIKGFATEQEVPIGESLKTEVTERPPFQVRRFPNIAQLEYKNAWIIYGPSDVRGILGIASTAQVKFDSNGQELLDHFLSRAGLILENMFLIELLSRTNQELQGTLERLHETQYKLIQSEKLASIGELTAGLVHEMNNPVNFISGNISHLQNYLEDILAFIDKVVTHKGLQEDGELNKAAQDLDLAYLRQDLPSMLKDMQEGVTRAQGIIADLRTFSGGEGGEGRKPANLKDVVESSLNILRHRWEGAIEVQRKFGDIPEVECNQGQISQVVMNLVNNAIDAVMDPSLRQRETKDSGKFSPRISIALKRDGDYVLIEVTDNGVGIPPENLAKLNQPFFTTKEVGRGMGLGLSISFNIVKNHKGVLEVQSKVGRGTTFTVKLPIQS